MPFVTSSVLGVDLNNASTTQLFALNTKVLGSDNSEWSYVYATAALATGQFVSVNKGGTANIFTSVSALIGAGVDGTTGNIDIGVAQFTVAASSYAWIVKRGQNVYVACSGSCIPGTGLAFGTGGQLVPMADAAAGATALGVATVSALGTATANVGLAILSYPRWVGTSKMTA